MPYRVLKLLTSLADGLLVLSLLAGAFFCSSCTVWYACVCEGHGDDELQRKL
jgi:hypothetical protein